jgi:hypothetical protein
MSKVRALSCLLLVLLSLFAVRASANAWEKIDDEDGIVVFRQEVPGSSFLAFKGITTIDAPIGKLLGVLADNEHRTEWVDRLVESRVVERKSAYDYVVYQHFSAPPLVSDRDYVYRGRAYRRGNSVVLEMSSTEHPKAPKTVGVRAHLHKSSYVLTPEGKNKTRVVVEIHTDPKGDLPSWIVNMLQKSWPRNTLTSFAKQANKPYVKALELPPEG